MTTDQIEDTAGQEGDQGAALTGRAAVRFYFLAPLAGLPRKRGLTADAHDRAVAGLVDKLAYMTPRNLAGLAELVLRHAMTPRGPAWPDATLIRSWAMTIQLPPPRQSDYAQSLIKSEMGRRAREQGWVVELFQIARRLGPPPGKYQISKLREEAEDNIRRRVRFKEMADAGRLSPDDSRWLDRWWADLAECEALLGMEQEEVAQ